MNSLSELIVIEQTIAKMLEEIRESILHDVNSAKIKNTISISNNISVVKLSNLEVWNAEYYIAHAQAEYISKKLQGVSTAIQMLRVIEEIVKTKKVKIGNHDYPINPSIIAVLTKYI